MKGRRAEGGGKFAVDGRVLEAMVDELDLAGPIHGTFRQLDQVGARFDRRYVQAAGHETSGELPRAAADLEHAIARRQAARRAGTVDELVRIGRPVAVVLDGDRVEGRAVASVVAIVRHGRRNLASPADGTAVRSPSFEVGGDGKPVGIRRGPATVIGDVGRLNATGDAGSLGRRDR